MSDRRTVALRDPRLPAVEALLGHPAPLPLQVALEEAGVAVIRARPIQVTWWPGSSITVRYRARLSGEGLDGVHEVVAVSGPIPDGALVVDRDGLQVGVWRVPHDPALPGLAPALDAASVSALLGDLGIAGGTPSSRLRTYRPGRRAVVEVRGRPHRLYLKLVRPAKVERIHREHRALPSELPVPHSLGFSPELGVLALQALPGVTLRRAMDDGRAPLPGGPALTVLLDRLPAPTVERSIPSPIDRLPDIAGLLRALLPEHAARVDRIVAEIGDDPMKDSRPVHGDFYEAQVLVDRGEIVGLLDIDTFGWGRPADDPATMIGHLAVWQTLSSQPERARLYGGDLLRYWDRRLDQADLRRRAAAVILSLATGPFRVQLRDWPGETERRIAMAERWVESARRGR